MAFLFAHSVHTLYTHEKISAKGSCKKFTKCFIFGYVSMQHLSLKDSPDLFINHLIVLGYKNHIKTKMPVHCKKFYPLQPVFLVPGPRVKYRLALIQNNKRLMFKYLAFFISLMKLQRKILKTIYIRKCIIADTLATDRRLKKDRRINPLSIWHINKLS